ncbi:MAG TPA: rod shape-determining protein MreD [Porticoccaceae bacterium]|nr:rod shape-determining protein MreD [Porticoccaceae bacterium]
MIVKTEHLPLPVVFLGLAIALILNLIPLRSELAFWRPPLVLLVVVYCVIREPRRFGLVFAWCTGLIQDLMLGGILCQHATAMAAACYLVVSQEHRLHHFNILYQCLFVAVVVFVYQTIFLAIRLVSEDLDIFLPLFYSVFTGALVWPLLYSSMLKLQGQHW